jgi:asparagine synthase (glutamine-hydrolysing)
VCGIAGLVGLPGGSPPTEATARAMAERLAHRGPDDRTTWGSPSGRCALGHARLRVIDLATGGQPMPNETGSVQAVFNGEIYNFRHLRAELEKLGHHFRSKSDTEVLVHGYEAWGDALPEHLDGMFAFALWDEPRKRLLLARDRPGKKPLFYARSQSVFAFASEIKALLAVPEIRAASGVDGDAFPFYLAYGYVPPPRTFYKGVHRLPPATACVLEGDGELRDWRYWRLDFTPRPISYEAAKERVRETTRAAVQKRLVADVPLGAFLSGGIDSTVVVGLMSELTAAPVHTFSLGFADDPTFDETRYARLAAERFGTKHTEFVVEADALELVDALVDAYDEPFGDSSAIPTHVVSGLTRRHVTVALTGDGGDELFAGYLRLPALAWGERLPRWLGAAAGAVAAAIPHTSDFRGLPRRAARFLSAAALPPEERMLRWIGYLPDQVGTLLRPGVGGGVSRDALLAHFRAPLARAMHLPALARALALNFETYLPEDLLVKADRCSMAHGLELRSPLLDTALTELAASLPANHLVRGRTLKRVFREAFADLLPEPILRRAKMGFGVPLPLWFRTRWRPVFESRVLDPAAPIWDWLVREPVLELWREHQEQRADHGHALWALLTLSVWLERSDAS